MNGQNTQLDRVRKLLAKAEAEGVTQAEAEALTAKAAELMARYGIDRALLAASNPDTDRPADKIITVPGPWAAVRAHLLYGITSAMRCTPLVITGTRGGTAQVHVFGYASDIERAELVCTSLLIQMARGLAVAQVPERTRSVRAWRRSWLLGFATAVIRRIRAAEQHAARQAAAEPAVPGSHPAALVLTSREQVIARHAAAAYPVTRRSRVSYSGTGYRDGFARGNRADIGTARLPVLRPSLH